MMGSMMRRGSFGDGATLDLAFTTMNSTADLTAAGFTFTRSTSATYINASGFVATASANQARFDYDPTTLAPRGLLIEASANNQVTNSGTFSSATWTYVQTSSGTAVLAPDNTQTAILLQENSTTNQHVVSQGSRTVTANAANTASMWIRRNGTRRYILLRVNDNSSNANAASVMFDTQTGTVSTNGAATAYGTFSAASATVTPYPAYDGTNEWYRLSMTFTVPVGMTLVSFKAELSATDSRSADGQSVSYLGNGTNGVYVWGAQLEAGSGASSYIPTGASTGSRASDKCISDSISGWYTQGIGTVLVSARPLLTTSRTYWNFSAGASVPRIQLYSSGGTDVTAYLENPSGTGANIAFPTGSISNGTLFKAAWAFQTGSHAACVNGNAVATSSTSSPAVPTSGMTRFTVGHRYDEFNQFYGHIASVKYWPTRLANADLQALTA